MSENTQKRVYCGQPLCKDCGEPIYDGKGTVVKGGFWVCDNCKSKDKK